MQSSYFYSLIQNKKYFSKETKKNKRFVINNKQNGKYKYILFFFKETKKRRQKGTFEDSDLAYGMEK